MSVEPTTKSLSVLLVDDDTDTRNMFQMVMDHHHVDFVAVRDAESALDYLRINSPDVIVIDIMLPGMDGYQALNRIRSATLAPNAVVVATTAYYNTDTQGEMLDRGFNGYLPKPLNPASLMDYLQKIAGR